MTGWRDVIAFEPGTPDVVVAKATAALDAAEPWLPLGRMAGGYGLPITICWYTPPSFENWTGQSDYSQVRLNADGLAQDAEWEPTLIHELVHVLDKHCLTNADRARVMATVTGCLSSVFGRCVEPLTPVWSDPTYTKECQELFASAAAQHIWSQIRGDGAADLAVFGYYTFDPAVTIPVILDVLAGPKTAPQSAPTPPQEDPAMLVKSWIYGEGADLLAAMSAARATGAAVVTNRGEAAALIKAGATITVIGGPACTALGLVWATAGRVVKGTVTACNGATYADSLALALAS